MLEALKKHVINFIENLDGDNSNISEEEAIYLINILNKVSTANSEFYSKYKAYSYLNISRASFDNYVKKGFLPKGKKILGFKELGWYKKDLDAFIDSRKNI